MSKLDESKVQYIVRENRKDTKNAVIAEQMGVTTRWVQKLWARYKNVEPNQLVYPKHMGWTKEESHRQLEHSAVMFMRILTGHGMFEHTTWNALLVLETAIKNHGKPKAILTDHGTQFYANADENKKKGTSKFETRLDDLNIKHILSRVGHPQTNGKVERLFDEIQRKLSVYTAYMQRTSNPVDMFIQW